jgi:glycosyltransferase involved in cell wall biosynthesis
VTLRRYPVPMKVSGFTFLRNVRNLGYPFAESIRSILPIVDEFVVALGPCDDDTPQRLREIRDPKIRVIPTQWNERIRSDYSVKGFVYGQQKSIALFNCTGDWAFYLEADEVVHENDLPKIRAAMERYLDDERVEALAFDYFHFYGNANTYAWSPRWYRTEARILRNTIPAWGPEGLYFVVLDTQKRGRYPRAAHTGATLHHYGWLKTRDQFELKMHYNAKYWDSQTKSVDYAEIDPQVLREFKGTHPKVVHDWLPRAEGVFPANPRHQLTGRERKHRLMMMLERWTGWQSRKKHYRLVQ